MKRLEKVGSEIRLLCTTRGHLLIVAHLWCGSHQPGVKAALGLSNEIEEEAPAKVH